MWTLFRLGVLAGGIALGVLGYRAWFVGVPPAWSIFAPNAETVVTVSEPRDEVRPDGKVRHWPHVEVAWPPGSATNVVLQGLLRPKNPYKLHTAEELVLKNPVGKIVTVRNVNGAPYANRRDLRDLSFAFGFSILSVPMTLAGLLMLTGLPGGRRKED